MISRFLKRMDRGWEGFPASRIRRRKNDVDLWVIALRKTLCGPASERTSKKGQARLARRREKALQESEKGMRFAALVLERHWGNGRNLGSLPIPELEKEQKRVRSPSEQTYPAFNGSRAAVRRRAT